MRCALAVLLALIVSVALPGAAHADQQRDPELKDLLQKIMGSSSDCFTDKYESVVWYKAMEPRLAQFVPTHEERVEILDHVFCEAKRDPSMQIPPFRVRTSRFGAAGCRCWWGWRLLSRRWRGWRRLRGRGSCAPIKWAEFWPL
jgi:hypothetical protein